MYYCRHPFILEPSSNTNYRVYAFEGERSEEEFDAVQFVIFLENESGQEFFLAESNVLVGFTDTSDQSPILVETYQEISDQLNRLRQKHSSSWWIYTVDRNEFDTWRQQQVQPPEPDQ